jgi:hypothetical protein
MRAGRGVGRGARGGRGRSRRGGASAGADRLHGACRRIRVGGGRRLARLRAGLPLSGDRGMVALRAADVVRSAGWSRRVRVATHDRRDGLAGGALRNRTIVVVLLAFARGSAC